MLYESYYRTKVRYVIEEQYFCPVCAAVFSDVEYNTGIQTCINKRCSRFGKALTKQLFCTDCETYFLPGLTHTHAPNFMPRFKLPSKNEKNILFITEAMVIQNYGGEVNG